MGLNALGYWLCDPNVTRLCWVSRPAGSKVGKRPLVRSFGAQEAQDWKVLLPSMSALSGELPGESCSQEYIPQLVRVLGVWVWSLGGERNSAAESVIPIHDRVLRPRPVAGTLCLRPYLEAQDGGISGVPKTTVCLPLEGKGFSHFTCFPGPVGILEPTHGNNHWSS